MNYGPLTGAVKPEFISGHQLQLMESLMSNIINLRINYDPSRNQAMRWLIHNIKVFPSFIEENIGPNEFHGWRFVLGSDGVIYFANCIDRGISKDDFVFFGGKANVKCKHSNG